MASNAVEAAVAYSTLAEIPSAPDLFVSALKQNETFLRHRPDSDVSRALAQLAGELVPPSQRTVLDR